MSNGTRQGSFLSPYLFASYIKGLILAIGNLRIGCNVGGMFFSILAYTDDLILRAPSYHAMQ